MSQSYRVKVKESVTETIQNELKSKRKINMLPLMPAEQMGQMLGNKLLQKGWAQDEDCVTTVLDGFELKFNPKTQTLDIVLIQVEEVVREVDGLIDVYDGNYDEARANSIASDVAKSNLRGEIRSYQQKKQRALQDQWKEQMPEVHKKVEELLEDALLSTHQEALRQKASGLGEVVSEVEDNGDLVIRVKV